MKSSKAISTVISTVIIASVSLIIIIIMMNYAIFTLESTVQQAEFEQTKNLMKSVAESTVDSILTGTSSIFKFPSRTTISNFITSSGQVTLTMYYSSSQFSTIVGSSYFKMVCYAGSYVNYENEVIYGSLEMPRFVSDLYDLPLLYSMWDTNLGRTTLKLNFLRLAVQEYDEGNIHYIDLIYISPFWESAEEGNLEYLDIKYKNQNITQLYSDSVVAQQTVTFEFDVTDDADPPEQYSVQINHNCILVVRLIKHIILFYSR